MQDVKLIDLSFIHQNHGGSSKCAPPKNKWYRGPDSAKVTILTDSCLHVVGSDKDTKYVFWAIEPNVINPNSYKFIHDNQDKCSLVISHDKNFLKTIDPKKARYCHFGGLWVNKYADLTKTKNISIVASNKNYTEGHQLRHKVIKELSNKMDVYGGGYKPLEDKTEAIGPYRYSIAIENCQIDGYFTEKICDAFINKCVPIYWGDPNIGMTFDKNGIMYLDEIEDATEEYYQELLPYIDKNYEIAKNYLNADDKVYKIVKELL